MTLCEQCGQQQCGELADERAQILGLRVVDLRARHHREQHTLTCGTVGDPDVVGAAVVAAAGLVGGGPPWRQPCAQARRLVCPHPVFELLPLRRGQGIPGEQGPISPPPPPPPPCVPRTPRYPPPQPTPPPVLP